MYKTRDMFLARTWVVKRLQIDKKNTVDLSVGLLVLNS